MAHIPKAPDSGKGRPTLLVTVKEVTALVAIDLETGEVVARAKTGSKPHELTLSKDRKTGFISIYGTADYGRNEPNNEIGVIDLERMTEIKRIDLDLYKAPHGMATDGNGDIWITVEENRSVLVVDPVDYKIKQTVWVQAPVHFSATSPDGSRIYFSHKEYPFVSVVDVASRAVLGRIGLPRGGQGLSVSPDGAQLFVGDFNEPLMHVFDCNSERQVETIELAGVPGWPYPTPDGRFVIATTYNEPEDRGFVEIFDARTLAATGRIDLDTEPFHAVSDDTGDFAYVALADGRIPKLDLAAATIAEDRLHATGAMPEALAIIHR